MATPTADTYVAASGEDVYGGTSAPSVSPVEFNLVAAGGWTWYNDERAIVHNNATYAAFNAGGGGSGHMRAAKFDHATDAITTGTITTSGSGDEHMCPALVPVSDGRLLAFYCTNPDTWIRYRYTSAANSVAAWDSVLTTPVTPYNCVYVNPRLLTGPNKLVLFSRCIIDTGKRTHVYNVSGDEGGTWGSWVEFCRPSGATGIPYAVSTYKGTDEVHFLMSSTHPVQAASSIYHFYAKWHVGDGALRFYKSDGTQITDSLPFDPTAGTLVYDGSSQRAWTWDIAIDGSGNPCALFTKYPSNNGTDIRMMASRWNGSAWTTPVDIAGASVGTSLYGAEAFYTGGACYDRSDVDVVYLSREVATGVYEMQKWRSSNSGSTWAKVRDLSTGTAAGQDNYRPFSPRNANSKFSVVWAQGTYTTYDNWSAKLIAANSAG
jgi:hypothetical protein